MLNLTKHIMPQSVEVEHKTYPVRTDHAYWIRFAELLTEKPLLSAFDFMYTADVPENRAAGLEALIQFCYPPEEMPNSSELSTETETRTIDYKLDGSMIYAAFMQCYKIDIIDTPMHWHKFLALLNNITGTQLNTVIGFRLHRNTSEKYENYMERMRRVWELPELEDTEQNATVEKFNKQFN